MAGIRRINETMFASKCRACGATIAKGTAAYFDPSGTRGQKMMCVGCGSASGRKSPAAPAPTAAPTQTAWGRDCDASETSPRVDRSGKQMRIRFDSVEHIVACATRGASKNPANDRMISDHHGDRLERGFFNGVGFSNLAQRVREPMPEIVSEVEKVVAKYHADNVAQVERPMRRRRRGLNDGDEIDSDRFLARIPEMWERVERVPVQSRVVKIAVNCTLASNKGWREMMWRGAAAFILAEALAARGVSVEIVGVRAVRDLTEDNEGYVAEFPVKASGEMLNFRDLVTVLCDPGFTRAGGMNACARCAKGRIADGWGWPLRSVAGMVEADYLIDYEMLGDAEVARWVNGHIEALEAPAADAIPA